ncbi:hypothetical protein L1049_009330 [Liquidambar formosana]|uniref:PPM-type phosphatase domain-containing protein n=1 Tax=Liquidambar formosana TaxID=63359 RepID=A0AAP0X6A8_LIQFO
MIVEARGSPFIGVETTTTYLCSHLLLVTLTRAQLDMGACCSKDGERGESMEDEMDGKGYEVAEEVDVQNGDDGAIVWFQGYSGFTSMFTQKGMKGINQDAMTVWENFTGEKDTYFCGVFDGHGESGHNVARHVRNVLPSKLSSEYRLSQFNGFNHSDVDADDGDENDDSSDDTKDSHENDDNQNQFLTSWRSSIINSFKEIDEELSRDSTIDCLCSGTTAVTIVKQGDHLIIANLGDSRAVLGTRGQKKRLVPVQLTVDMKPNLPCEAERIKNCKGRIFSMQQEPEVFRMWMPDENCPGLAMSRAFGDFCLKEHGLISIPEVSYRKLTDRDEFVVLATDGVWDVLRNNEVVKIVASARKRSIAAKLVVDSAVEAWRVKYPSSKVDDCAVICFFLKDPPLLTKSRSEAPRDRMNHSELAASSTRTTRSEGGHESVNGTVTEHSSEEWSALEGVSRVNSLVATLPRFADVLSQQK